MEIIERITETLEKTDKKATDLCDRLGIRTSTMSTWKTRNSDPPAKYIKPIADFLGVSVHYLLTGEEAPARKLTTAEEDELLELYRALPQNKQFEFIGGTQGISESLYRVSEIPRQRKKDYQFRMVPTLRPVLRRCAYE